MPFLGLGSSLSIHDGLHQIALGVFERLGGYITYISELVAVKGREEEREKAHPWLVSSWPVAEGKGVSGEKQGRRREVGIPAA